MKNRGQNRNRDFDRIFYSSINLVLSFLKINGQYDLKSFLGFTKFTGKRVMTYLTHHGLNE